MVGKSTCGSGATGRNGKATRPTKASAAISSVVATGRRMKGSERFTTLLPRPLAGVGDAHRDRRVALELVLPVGHDAFAVRRGPR